MPAVGALVRCTDGSWMTRPPQSCSHGHRLRPGARLVGHQPCSICRGGHTTWTCLAPGAVVYWPALHNDCRVLTGRRLSPARRCVARPPAPAKSSRRISWCPRQRGSVLGEVLRAIALDPTPVVPLALGRTFHFHWGISAVAAPVVLAATSLWESWT